MGFIINFLKDIADKIGLSSTILIIPLFFVTLMEIIANNLNLDLNLKFYFTYVPFLSLFIYFIAYFYLRKYPEIDKKIGFNTNKEKLLLFRSGVYLFSSLVLSSIFIIVIINYISSIKDNSLIHSEETSGLAVLPFDYKKLDENNIDVKTFTNLFEEGFIKPLDKVIKNYYEKSEKPEIILLPNELPRSFKASIFEEAPDYSEWAKDRGYDIIIHGGAQNGVSDSILLDLNFNVLTEPKIIKVNKDQFSLNYTISNYDNESLIASFDNMVQEIAGILLYLDGKFEDSQKILVSIVDSLKREIKDYNDENAKTEIERKKFKLRREQIRKNIGIVYFYLGNSYLLAGLLDKSEESYKYSQEYLQYSSNKKPMLISSKDTLDSLQKVQNNLSITYAKAKKFDLAEEMLKKSGAENSDSVILSQNLGIVYLEQGLGEVSSEKLEDLYTQNISKISKEESDKNDEIIEENDNMFFLFNESKTAETAPMEDAEKTMSPGAPSLSDSQELNDGYERKLFEQAEGKEENKYKSDSSKIIGIAEKNIKSKVKLEKAIEIFNKIDEKIAKEKNKTDQKNQEVVLKNVYKNQAIVSLIQNKVDKAKEYLKENNELIKN